MEMEMNLYANHCVWVSHTQIIFKDGKRRRVRRSVPKVYAGTVYTMWRILEPEPFVGWTLDALRRGTAARHYGRPVGMFPNASQASLCAGWLANLLEAGLGYGDPLRPLQIGWNGNHRGNFVTIDGVEVEMHGCTRAAPDTTSFGNLVWARATGLRTDHRKESMVLLDLEQIQGDRRYETYVGVVHAYPRDYDNSGIYVSEITHVYNERARKILLGKENKDDHE